MNAHLNRIPSAAPNGPGAQRCIKAGKALSLGRLGGELSVLQGRVWLTRDGDLGDHRVESGERVRLGVAENAVIE